MYDFMWGFILEQRDPAPLGRPRQSSDIKGPIDRQRWHLRAPSEALRLAWADKLIRASRWAVEQQGALPAPSPLVQAP